jgi:hypothetical protein
LRASYVLLDYIELLPISLGTKFCSFQMTPFGFSLVFGHLCELFIFSSSFFCSSCSCVGVDNALIKGEIANTRLICALVVHFVMSDYQHDP